MKLSFIFSISLVLFFLVEIIAFNNLSSLNPRVWSLAISLITPFVFFSGHFISEFRLHDKAIANKKLLMSILMCALSQIVCMYRYHAFVSAAITVIVWTFTDNISIIFLLAKRVYSMIRKPDAESDDDFVDLELGLRQEALHPEESEHTIYKMYIKLMKKEKIFHNPGYIKWAVTMLLNIGLTMFGQYCLAKYNVQIKSGDIKRFSLFFLLYMLTNCVTHFLSLFQNIVTKEVADEFKRKINEWINVKVNSVSSDYIDRHCTVSFHSKSQRGKNSLSWCIGDLVSIFVSGMKIVVITGSLVYLSVIPGLLMFALCVNIMKYFGAGRIVEMRKFGKKFSKEWSKTNKSGRAFVKAFSVIASSCNPDPEKGEILNDPLVKERLKEEDDLMMLDIENRKSRNQTFFGLYTMGKLAVILAVVVYCLMYPETWSDIEIIVPILVNLMELVHYSVDILNAYSRVIQITSDWTPFQEALDKFPSPEEYYEQRVPSKHINSIVFNVNITLDNNEKNNGNKSVVKCENKKEQTFMDKLGPNMRNIIHGITGPALFDEKDSGPVVVKASGLSLVKGDNVAIIGATGSGKTTLCKFIAGWLAEKLFESQMIIDGEEVIGGFRTLVKYHTHFSTQGAMTCDFTKSVHHIITFHGSKLRKEICDQLIALTIAITELDDLTQARNPDLWEKDLNNCPSGGQRTRLKLANELYKILSRYYATGYLPSIVIFDEPDAGVSEGFKGNDLDKKMNEKAAKNKVKSILSKIYNIPVFKNIMTLSIIHHYDSAKDLFNKVWIVEDGNVVQM